MTIHTYHLAELRPSTTARVLLGEPMSAVPGPSPRMSSSTRTGGEVPGLRHAECLALMQLGAPTVSPSRMQLRRLAVFAEWEHDEAIDAFLTGHDIGRQLADGWHVRMQFLRRYGQISVMPDLPERDGRWDPDEPVVAVTLARLKLPELPRFLRWGKPVERLVLDHPGTTLALAAVRPPRTFSTFSIWRSVRAMTDMVHGHSAVADAHVHADAMTEQRRRDFHHESAFMRFRPLSEHGAWQGRRGLIPTA